MQRVVPGVCLSWIIPFFPSPGCCARGWRHLEPSLLLIFCDSKLWFCDSQGYGCWLLNQITVEFAIMNFAIMNFAMMKFAVMEFELWVSPSSSWQVLISKLRIQLRFTGHSADHQFSFSFAQICCNLHLWAVWTPRNGSNQNKKKRSRLKITHQKSVFYEVYTTAVGMVGGCTTKWYYSIWIY